MSQNGESHPGPRSPKAELRDIRATRYAIPGEELTGFVSGAWGVLRKAGVDVNFYDDPATLPILHLATTNQRNKALGVCWPRGRRHQRMDLGNPGPILMPGNDSCHHSLGIGASPVECKVEKTASRFDPSVTVGQLQFWVGQGSDTLAEERMSFMHGIASWPGAEFPSLSRAGFVLMVGEVALDDRSRMIETIRELDSDLPELPLTLDRVILEAPPGKVL